MSSITTRTVGIDQYVTPEHNFEHNLACRLWEYLNFRYIYR